MAQSAMLGFNGETHEAGTRWQLLGNGRRAFNPVLLRFHSPDRLSPFGRGGTNAYAYCADDPINFSDPTGQFAVMALGLLGAVGALAPLVMAKPEDDSGGGGGVSPWLIAGVVAALALLGGVAAAARRKPFERYYKISNKHVTRGPDGQSQVQMRNLRKPVIDQIMRVRDHSSHGVIPDSRRLPQAKVFKNAEARLPHRPDEPGLYWRYYVTENRSKYFRRTRIITESEVRPGIKGIYVTDDHYHRFLRVSDWKEYQPWQY